MIKGVLGRIDGATFVQNFIRRKVQRAIAMGMTHTSPVTRVTWRVPGLCDLMKDITPAQLQRLIDGGASMIGAWEKLIPADLRQQGVKDLHNLRSIDLPGVVASINWDQVLDELAKAYPQHVAVVRRNSSWYISERERAREVMLRVLSGTQK